MFIIRFLREKVNTQPLVRHKNLLCFPNKNSFGFFLRSSETNSKHIAKQAITSYVVCIHFAFCAMKILLL